MIYDLKNHDYDKSASSGKLFKMIYFRAMSDEANNQDFSFVFKLIHNTVIAYS